MPYRARRRYPRRRRKVSTLRKRLARMRRARTMRKRKSYYRRRRLGRVRPHSKTNGFPSNKVVTLKYVDTVTDATPTTEGALIGRNGPAFMRFSANHCGRPDMGPLVWPPNSRVKNGENPHQPMGYDQYTMIYERSSVIRSRAIFDVTYSTKDGTNADGSDDLDLNNVSVKPAGLYVGIIKMWSRDLIELPVNYAEFLERFKRPLRFLPFNSNGTTRARLTATYIRPSVRAVEQRLEAVGSSQSTPVVDPFTLRNGDLPSSGEPPEKMMQLTGPRAEQFYQLVVYYPDTLGRYVQGATSEDRFSLRATVKLYYTIKFMRQRQLQSSGLYTTPGMNYQHVSTVPGGEGEGFDTGGDGIPDAGDAPAVKRARADEGIPDGDGDGIFSGDSMGFGD